MKIKCCGHFRVVVDLRLGAFRKLKVPPRVVFFTWKVTLGKLLTVDNLRKRRVVVVDWYCMCKTSGETTNHLLLYCSVERVLVLRALSIWNELGNAYLSKKKKKKSWVMLKTVTDIFILLG